MKGEWDEGLEAPRFILEFTEPQQVVGAMEAVLDVAVEHRGVAPETEFVCGAVDLEPLLGVGLVLADLVADLGVENLGPTAGEAAKPGLFELHEDVADASLREVTEPVDLDRRPGLEMERWIRVVQNPDDVEIPVIALLVMKTPDDVHLGRARVDRLLTTGQDLLVIHHIAAGLAEIGPEGAERAAIDADVCGIEMGVDVVVGEVAAFPLADEVGQFPQFVKVESGIPERLSLSGSEPNASLHLLTDWIQGRGNGSNHQVSKLHRIELPGRFAAVALPKKPHRARFGNRNAAQTHKSAAIEASSTIPIAALAIKKAWLTRERSSGRTIACSQASRPAIAAKAAQ